LQQIELLRVDSPEVNRGRVTLKSVVIGALLVAVVILGYLYWDSRTNTVFKAPGIEIKKN
jgi:predicted negative regulator of RcsB-dependent stress response